MSLHSEFKTLIDALNRSGIDYALCGGLAMAVYNLPRATMDIDLLILTDDLGKIKQTARSCGYTTETGSFRIKAARTEICRLVKIVPNEPPLVLDLLLAKGDLLQVFNSRQRVDWNDKELFVVSREGLIRMKQMRNSGKDRDDIDFLKNEN